MTCLKIPPLTPKIKNYTLIEVFSFQKHNHGDQYIPLEGLGDLCLKKHELTQTSSENATLKAQAKEYYQKAHAVLVKYFPADSPHIKRVQDKIEALRA